MNDDVTQSLKDTENALRDFIALVLGNDFGKGWVEKCGLPQERILKWRERKEVEEKRQKGGTVEERLIYYADFYDVLNILKKNWGKFAPALGELKTMEVYLNELEKLRDPDAHRRELLPHQKHLAAGIAGEVRTRLIRYRSKLETAEDCFPRIESIRDNLGNILSSNSRTLGQKKTILRPGDFLEFVVTASDPSGESLEYQMSVGNLMYSKSTLSEWQSSHEFRLSITEHHIRKDFYVGFSIKSPRPYHAHEKFDDRKLFDYVVLPKRS